MLIDEIHKAAATLVPAMSNVPVLSEQCRSALEAELRAAIQGEVRFDRGVAALYATDGSNYRQVPIGVVSAARRRCGRHRSGLPAPRRPLLSRGGGTSLAGQCCNVAVVMDLSKYMHRVLEIDPGRRTRRACSPAPCSTTLRDAAEQYHLTFGPDPATHKHCTLGGMVGNNSCGIHAQYGGTDRRQHRRARDPHL